MAEILERVWIPEVSGKHMRTLAKRVRQIMKVNGRPYYVQPVNIKKPYDPLRLTPTEKAIGIRMVEVITTYHPFHNPKHRLKPTVADVYAQIPAPLVDFVTAFEITQWPRTEGEIMREMEAAEAGFHVAMTKLYCKLP